MLNNEFYIENKLISNYSTPYIIGEIGSNFNQSIDEAYKLIDCAANANVDAVKFQLFQDNQEY